jgi:hypothetical protein
MSMIPCRPSSDNISESWLCRSDVLPLVIAGGLAAALVAAVLLIIHYFGPGGDNILFC